MTNSTSAPTYRSGTQSVAPVSGVNTDARAGALSFLGMLAAELSGGTVDLPCFPDVVLRIRKALANPNTRPEQVVTIVGAEPRLTAKLLQTANSVAFNVSGRPLVDLRAAITRLGHQLVQSAAMAYAVQQMKAEKTLDTIVQPLNVLWKDSIAVASIAQVVARRTSVAPDEAFLTGLLHGFGRLYILVRAVGCSADNAPSFLETVIEWQSSIGKAVLENWGFAQEISDAVGDQGDHERKRKPAPDLTDVLIVSILLGETMQRPGPRIVDMNGVTAFQAVGLTDTDCSTIMTHAEYQLGSLHEALGC